jgi:hypothetical protein
MFFLRIMLMLGLVIGSAYAAPPVENKWRLQFSGNAESDGRIVLAITPRGGERREIAVDIARGTGENRVARTVMRALRAAIGDDYHVEVDDGEDVLIKRRHGRPVFNVSVVEIGVRGVRINPDQE